MKKKHIIWLTVVFVICASLALFIYFQWNNIGAIIDTLRYSQEEVTEKMETNKQELQDYIDNNENVNVRDLTQEEADALNKGELTEDEVVEILTTKPEAPPEENANTNENPKPNNKENDKKEPTKEEAAGQRVSEAIARLYIQKNAYLSKLDVIEAEARAEFIATCKGKPQEVQKEGKMAIISKYLPKVAAWEKECDTIVYGILDEVRAALKESGQSQEVADKIEQAYLDEKRLKKSYFIGRYMD